MRNIVRLILYLASLAVCLAVIITCIKVEKKVMVATGSVNNVLANTALAEGTLVDIGEGVSDHGHVYSTTKDVTMSGTKIGLGSKGTTGTYTSQLTGLTAGTTYYIKAYVMGIGGTELGKEISFKTADPVIPAVTTADATSLTTTTASSGGEVNSDGGAPVTARGVCWSILSEPTVDGNKTTDGTGTGIFTSNLSGLADGTTYYVRAYGTNSAGTGYGSEKSFTTVRAVLPTVVTSTPVNISSNSAQGGGDVTSDGGVPLLAKGICWSKNPNPTLSDPKTDGGTGTGEFENSMGLLEPATLYHVRAYATNSEGTAYGDDKTFTTVAGIPVVVTAEITGITGTGALSGGSIPNDGGAAIITRGVCWNTTGAPKPEESKTTDGSGAGLFSSTITGLTANTKYYVRAYATNSIGLSFGEELTFTTLGISLATVTTSAPVTVTATTADPGGEVTDDNGSTVTVRGVCYNTLGSPTTDDSKKDEAAGKGTFTMSLTGLTPSTTYYARAFAVNSVGTAYGPQIQFTTPATPASISTTSVTGLASTSVITGGNITSDGGSAILTRGVVWSTGSAPTIALTTKTNNGSGSGVFVSRIPDLLPETTYNVRAYATNSAGTTFYGNEVTFTTTIQVIFDSHTYNTVQIGTQLWFQENLRSTKYRDGADITHAGLDADWDIQTDGAYCWYDNNAVLYDQFGILYNYYTTINNHNMCPSGWRVPTNEDWTVLTSYLGGESVAGGKLREEGNTYWATPNSGATNESGFTARGGGFRLGTGAFMLVYENGTFWTSSGFDATNSWYRGLGYNSVSVSKTEKYKDIGFSVRCLQGEGMVLPAVTTTAISGVSSTGAVSGGNVTSDGNSAVTERGICWSTSPGPTVELSNKTTDGTTGPGSYSSTITGLSGSTPYFVRAYATNSVGTAYGNEISFITSSSTVPGAPTIGTATAGDAQATVTFTEPLNDGGSAITGYTVTSSPGGHTGTGSLSPITVTGLTNLTAYTFTVVATNIIGNSASSAASNSVMPSVAATTVTDFEGNIYNIVTIGTQTWMAENLKTTKFNDGSPIPNIADNAAWAGLTTEAYCDYENNPANSTTYGRLYKWYAVNKNICPTGWHVPTDAEWTALTTYLGGEAVAGGKLKETGITHWASPNTGATNETGFTALPGGSRSYSGTFETIGIYGYWWSATENDATDAWARYLSFSNINVYRLVYSKQNGFSVRCVRN